jgi:DNA replication complex GINS protein SLD5 C-terminus
MKWLVMQDAQSIHEVVRLISPLFPNHEQIEFLKGYGKLVENYLRRTVLDHVSKDALKNLDESEMIDTPDLEQYVFVNINEACEIDLGTEEKPNIQQHDEGTTLITRYNVVRELFIQGKVDLIL